ncbi:MAG: hypothetical protein HQL56_07125 [Magnetococcales bacterium]|nr:hypothetical protein [Magnetococcales bacterium]
MISIPNTIARLWKFIDRAMGFSNVGEFTYDAEKQLEKNGNSLNMYAAMFGVAVGGAVAANFVYLECQDNREV